MTRVMTRVSSKTQLVGCIGGYELIILPWTCLECFMIAEKYTIAKNCNQGEPPKGILLLYGVAKLCKISREVSDILSDAN